MTTKISGDVAAHVLWHYNLGGYPAGTFTSYLLSAWGCADGENQRRLRAGWPDYALALEHGAPGEGDGVEWLRALAQHPADPPPEPADIPVRRQVDGKWQTVEITLSEFRRVEGADGCTAYRVR